MATFQMEMRQQQQQQKQKQRTNLKQRATATATSKTRRQRQHLELELKLNLKLEPSDPPQSSPDCIRLWPGSGPSTADRVGSNPLTCNTTGSSNISDISNIARPSSNIGRQRALMMLSMLVVVIALISGNGGESCTEKNIYTGIFL